MIYKLDQIVRALKNKNVNYYHNGTHKLILRGIYSDYYNKHDYIQFVRIYQNNNFNFGEVYHKDFIFERGGDYNKFIPLEWLKEHKSHLPKWW